MAATRSPRIRALLTESPVCIVDVGARGGFQEKWDAIGDLCRFVGFEPEATEAQRLMAAARPNEHYLACALAAEVGTAVLHHAWAPSRSSLFEPNLELLAELYGKQDSLYGVERTETIPVTTLDELLRQGRLPEPNFIKLDTQGSEVDILRGAKSVLGGSLCAIELEVEFVPLYRGQPLFSDVDAFLRAAGYTLLGFPNLYTRFDLRFGDRPGRTRETFGQFVKAWGKRLIPPEGKLNSMSQLVYGDALYLRSQRDLIGKAEANDKTQVPHLVTKAVVITAELHCYEYALELVRTAAQRGLIDDELRGELEQYVRARSRSWDPIVTAARTWSGRLLRRVRGKSS